MGLAPPSPAAEYRALSRDAQPMSGAASRYATAIFELARDENALDAVAKDLEVLGKLIASSPDLQRVTRSPVFSRETQAKAMDEILTKGKAHKLTCHFILLVTKNRRLFLLDAIVRAFGVLLARHRGEIVAQVTTARSLDGEQMALLKAALKQAYGREPRIDVRVDPTLLAGLVVRVGSRMIDSSLKTKLANLKLALARG